MVPEAQVPPASTVKAALLGVTFSSVMGAAPGFCRVTVFAALFLPTTTSPKSRLVGLARMAGRASPTPDRPASTDDPATVTLSLPARSPSMVGTKATRISHLALEARGPVQPFIFTGKS